jgi:hypothetical protein
MVLAASQAMLMRFDGKLKSWNDELGFGFIEPLRGGQEIFVHIKSFPPGAGRPTIGLGLALARDPVVRA